jgi:CHAT domain-containing protein
MTLTTAGEILLPPSVRDKLVADRTPDGRPAEINRVLILPAADLGSVPFAALPIGSKSLIDRAAVVLLPDIDALFSTDRANSSDYALTLEESKALVVGDPDLSHDRDWVFQPLPFAAEEAQAVAELGDVSPLKGAEATRAKVMQALKERPALIYFATHGTSDPINPMDGSFLALKDGHLSGRDIKQLRTTFSEAFRNPMVVMSACQTGLGKVFEGGVFGLARAWHYAGAWQVAMSLWNVDDKATATLMKKFMSFHAESRRFQQSLRYSPDRRDPHAAVFMRERNRLLAGDADYNVYEPVHGAEFDLRAAMLAMRAENGDPALWAAFTLYGIPTIQRSW